MPLLRRPRLLPALLAAAILVSLLATTVNAGSPRAGNHHVGSPITLDTNLRSKSGLSAWAIDEYLAANTPLPPLGTAFIAAERKYRVNARFLLAAALHESGWGRSYISRVKHNLFGLNAYDRDPLRYASSHATLRREHQGDGEVHRDLVPDPGRPLVGRPADASEHAAVLVLVGPVGRGREPDRKLDPSRLPGRPEDQVRGPGHDRSAARRRQSLVPSQVVRWRDPRGRRSSSRPGDRSSSTRRSSPRGPHCSRRSSQAQPTPVRPI